MKRWKTSDMKALLERAVCRRDDISVDVPGGDVDTEVIYLDFGREGNLSIRGFRCDRPVEESEIGDVDVEAVELRCSNSDGRGGLQSSGKHICFAYGLAMSALRKAGFDVVACLKDYF